MKELTDLLDSVLGQTTFSSRSAKQVTPAQLRAASERNSWHDEEKSSAREAEPNIPDNLLSPLKNYLRPLLQEYIISGNRLYGYGQAIDFIGHAFPIDESGYSTISIPLEWRKMIYSPDYCDMTYFSRVSTVENFTKGMVKGAAVLGSERVTHLLSDWLEGKPVKYRISAMLNGPPVKAPLNPFAGVHIEPLPLSSDRLDASLPRRRGTSENEVFHYLGRTLVSIDVEVKPALFHPTELSPQNVQIEPIGGVDIATVCQALSLESDGYVDAGFYWHDYQELDAFSLSVDETTWTMGNGRDRNWSTPVTWRTEPVTRVTTLEFKRDQTMLDLSETELIRTLSALKTLKDSEKTRIAVSRWVKSRDPYAYLVDRFIDLRIVLECLYVQHKKKGIKNDIICYGPAHLSDNAAPKQHRRIKDDLKNAYETACDAVHTGSLEEKYEDKVRQTLRQIDFNEWDDWGKGRDGWNAWIEENKKKIKAWYPYIDTDLLYDIHRGKCGNLEDLSKGKYKEDIIDEYISNEYTRQSGSKLLSTAQDLCRRGILKLLKEGPPADWGDLILGSESE